MSSPPAPTVAAIASGLAGVTLATALVQGGELVKIQPAGNEYAIGTGGGGSSAVVQYNNVPLNQDGTSRSVTLIAAAGPGNGASIAQILYGRTIGVRFRKNTVTPPFHVIINGTVYPVLTSQTILGGVTLPGSVVQDADANTAVVAGLPDDGPHEVVVALAADPVVSRALVFYGWLLEKRVGYSERQRVSDINTTGTLTTTAAAIAHIGGAGGSTAYYSGIRGVLYTNTSGASVSVTVKYAATTIWQATIAAGASATLDLLTLVSLDGTTATLNHLASAASAVNFTLIEASA